MSSLWQSTRSSLDDSLALLFDSLGKLEAAKSVDTAAVIEQLKVAAESARNLRTLVLAEMPEASWRNREELEALIEEIQKRVEARTLEQLRSRLLALASQLERGTIVHRRAFRVNELNELRNQAIAELRSQAGLKGTPQVLPGPEADEWLEWACGLQDPEDAESLQVLHNRFARLDDFVANLEPNMWVIKTETLV
jgi:cobalamin biosynthesis Mg chelatase CobN